MSFNPYPAYKDSGIAWLGMVPEHWGVFSIKVLFNIVGGTTPKSDVPEYWDGDIEWVTPSDLSNSIDFSISNTNRKITELGLNSCGLNLIPKDSVILSTRAPIGSIGISSNKLCTNQGCKSLVSKNKSSSKYLAYFLSISTSQLNIMGKGTTFLELSGEELGKFKISLPINVEEQTAIADFLDHETARMDALVAEQKKLMLLLTEKRQALISHAVTRGLDPTAPMKDSGIAWLGMVPEHWGVIKLKQGYEVKLGKMLQQEANRECNELLPYLRAANIKWEGVDATDIKEMWFSDYEKKILELKQGDLLVSEGGDAGRSCLYFFELNKCYFQNSINRIRPKYRNSNTFLYYFIKTIKENGLIDIICNKSTITHFTAEKVNEVIITLPPPSEQTAIADFLDHETTRIDLLIQECERAINLINERRAALISAVVSGQIDVRNYKPRDL